MRRPARNPKGSGEAPAIASRARQAARSSRKAGLSKTTNWPLRGMTSKAADPDTLVASAKAYLGALNKLMLKRQRRTDAELPRSLGKVPA